LLILHILQVNGKSRSFREWPSFGWDGSCQRVLDRHVLSANQPQTVATVYEVIPSSHHKRNLTKPHHYGTTQVVSSPHVELVNTAYDNLDIRHSLWRTRPLSLRLVKLLQAYVIMALTFLLQQQSCIVAQTNPDFRNIVLSYKLLLPKMRRSIWPSAPLRIS
jgi:hypothetical protein